MQIQLHHLRPGQKGQVVFIKDQGPLGQRLQQMGFTNGSVITRARVAPLGDPSVYLVRGSALAIRNEDAGHILVQPVHIF